MADSGHWRSLNLRDIKNTLDSLREMIRKLKRGRTRLSSQIHEAIKNLEESKRMRDELNQLSSTISNSTNIEAMQPHRSTRENVFSQEDFMDFEDENMIPQTNNSSEFSYKINIHINNSAMSTESNHSPFENLRSMASADSSEENPDSEMESLHSSVGKCNSSLHFTDSSDDEFLDADNGSECFSHSSVHSFSENFSRNSQDQPITMYTADKNSESLQIEKANSSKEDVICMRINEYKKRIIPAPKEINIFENLQDEVKASISSAILTESDSQHPETEEFEGKRKYARNSSIISNVNFSDDFFKETKYTVTGPIEWYCNETVRNEYSKSSANKEVIDTDESVSEINSCTYANLTENFTNDVITWQNNKNITDDSLKQVEKDICSFGENSFIVSTTNSKTNFSENFSVDRNAGDNSKSPTRNKIYYKNESFNELGKNIDTNTNFSKSAATDKTFGTNHEKMMDNCSNRLQIEDFDHIPKHVNDSSLNQVVIFSESTSEKTDWNNDVETNNSKAFESKGFSDEKFNLSSKDERLGYEEGNFNHSRIDSYTRENTCKTSCSKQENNITQVVENDISTSLIGNQLYLENENFSDTWINSFSEKISPQNQMNELATQMHNENVLKFQNNSMKDDIEINNDASNVDSLNYSANCPTELVYSVNICTSFKNNYEESLDKKVEHLEERTTNHSDPCSTIHYHNMKLHKITAATSNDDRYPVDGAEFHDLNKRLDEHEKNFFHETDIWGKNLEKPENISELSVNGFYSTQRNFQNFDDESALTKDLEFDSVFEITSVNASHNDMSLNLNEVTSLSDDYIALETKNTVSLNTVSENSQSTRNVDVKQEPLLKKDLTE